MCIDVCIDMCVDMCIDIGIDVCVDICPYTVRLYASLKRMWRGLKRESENRNNLSCRLSCKYWCYWCVVGKTS